MIIGFSSSYSKSLGRVGSILYIDDVALTGWVGIDESRISGTDKIKVFPNPAKDDVTILAQIEEADNVQVIDASGKLAGVYKMLNHKVNINTSMFMEGIYFYVIRDNKERILTKGKFSITK
jgi:hypothetical protein